MHEIQICENMIFFLIVFSNKSFNRPDPNRTKPTSLVRFLFLKTVKTEPNRTDEDFIGSDIFSTKNQSKPKCYTRISKAKLVYIMYKQRVEISWYMI
jgi:hypothetical protein